MTPSKTQIIDKIKADFPRKLQSLYSVTPEEASDKQV
jgi:starch phosphorylase